MRRTAELEVSLISSLLLKGLTTAKQPSQQHCRDSNTSEMIKC